MRHSSAALVILICVFFCCFADAIPASIWDVSILTSPAPPPDEGPPLSAGALRDESKLKYEIAGIVGAYFFWVFVTLLLLLLVGKRLRHKIQTSNQTLSMEIVKPSPLSSHPGMSMDSPLKSPGKMASLRSWASGGKSHSHKPSNTSMATTIDEKIVEADRAKNMDEMAKLYAAVMIHDEEKSQKALNSSQTSPKTPSFPLTPRSPYAPSQMTLPPTPRSPYYQPHLSSGGPASPRSPRYPPEFQHLRNPSSEGKDHGIQPAAITLIHPLAPTPAEDVPTRASSQTSTRKFKASPLSLASTRSDSAQNKRRPSQISVRGQPISQPIPTASMTSAQESAIESPRIYNPGPPPPTPGQKSFVSSIQEENRRPSAPLSVTSTAQASNTSLPFRQFYADALRSAPPTKTTFLEKRESILGVHPKTGVPQTPYSPYTPFTPMTPITPRHLVTKEDRRRNRKKEGLKVLSEDDLVMSDEDMWGEMK